VSLELDRSLKMSGSITHALPDAHGPWWIEAIAAMHKVLERDLCR